MPDRPLPTKGLNGPALVERPTGFTPLLQLFERLALLGYAFDLAKWEAWVTGGLLSGVPPLPSNDCQIPHSIEERIRFILDVERRLAPGASVSKLAFYCVISGLDEVPPETVAFFIAESLSKFFVVGDGILRRLERRPARIGPMAERRLANAMAKAVLRDYPLLSTSSYIACQQLLATSFLIFFRSSWSNRRLHPHRRWQHIISPEFLDYSRLPVKTIADGTQPGEDRDVNMEPAADRERLFSQLFVASETSPKELFQAVRDSAMVITTAATQFPELQDTQPLDNPKGAFAQWVLTLLPAVLAAALLRVAQHTRNEKYSNLIPHRRETGLEAILRTVLVYWHT